MFFFMVQLLGLKRLSIYLGTVRTQYGSSIVEYVHT